MMFMFFNSNNYFFNAQPADAFRKLAGMPQIGQGTMEAGHLFGSYMYETHELEAF